MNSLIAGALSSLMHFLPDDPLTCHQPAALRGAEQPGAIASRLQVALLLLLLLLLLPARWRLASPNFCVPRALRDGPRSAIVAVRNARTRRGRRSI